MNHCYVQFGCGLCAPPGWRNFDAGPAFWIQKHTSLLNSVFRRKGYPIYPVKAIEYGDVTSGLPIHPQSVSGVYCSHVLEHLALDEFRNTLSNVFQYLKPGGIFRMVLPDLEFIVKQYLANEESNAAILMMDEMGQKASLRGLRSGFKFFFGRSRHLWMWDYKSLAMELKRAGFVNIRRAYFNDSVDPRFREVEEWKRWENCLGAECNRPCIPRSGSCS